MKKCIAVAVLMLGATLASAESFKITVDAENPIVTNSAGHKFLSYNMHFLSVPDKVYEVGCAVVNADCFRLEVGGTYNLTIMDNDDQNSYADHISFRIDGDGTKSGVFFNPYGKKVKESSN
jgi:hypothetical protein